MEKAGRPREIVRYEIRLSADKRKSEYFSVRADGEVRQVQRPSTGRRRDVPVLDLRPRGQARQGRRRAWLWGK